VAGILREVARSTDYVARYGGEEFAIIFPETPKAEAHQACERIRTRLADGMASQPDASIVTISVGLAAFPQDATTKEQLIYAADMALLAAKRSGKNQTRLASG